jgi:hypothetical protein
MSWSAVIHSQQKLTAALIRDRYTNFGDLTRIELPLGFLKFQAADALCSLSARHFRVRSVWLRIRYADGPGAFEATCLSCAGLTPFQAYYSPPRKHPESHLRGGATKITG